VDVTAIAEHQTYLGILGTRDMTALCEAAETGKEVLCAKASPHLNWSVMSELLSRRHDTTHHFFSGQLQSPSALRIKLKPRDSLTDAEGDGKLTDAAALREDRDRSQACPSVLSTADNGERISHWPK
jgi:hypothetical protein